MNKIKRGKLIRGNLENDQSEENSLSMNIIAFIFIRDQNDSPEKTRDYPGDIHSIKQTSLHRYAVYSCRS